MARPLDAAAIATICEHMNDDHADAIAGYARVFGNIGDALGARMTGLDASGMDLEVETAAGPRTARIAFDHTLQDADDAHQTLIRMARSH
jgi:putative heme iron utilization protein